MPLYEFECTQCGHVSEEFFARWSDADRLSITCPRCKTARADKLEISLGHFELKGRGWTRLAWDRFK